LSDKQSNSASSAEIITSDVEMLDENGDDGLSPTSASGHPDDDIKPKKRRRRRRRKPRHGEDQDLASNESETVETFNEIGVDGSENTLDEEVSVSNQSGASDKLLQKQKKSTPAKAKRAPRKNKKNETLKDGSNNSKTEEAIDQSAMTELTKKADGQETPRAKAKSRGRKKVIKEDRNLKDQADVTDGASVLESDVSTTKSEKKGTKSTKAKSTKTTKVNSAPEALEILSKEEKISEADDKSSKSEKDEKKKTRRRGWWSKDG
tara:strand:+ start:750 stop:1538 length:789 start_codon:yes stop_codon:yes gene_type:complete